MSDSFTWQAPGLPYQYGVSIRGEQVVWQWWSAPGLPPTEEAQPLAALAAGRPAIPSAWQQVPEPIWKELAQRASVSALGSSPTAFAPALAAPGAVAGAASAARPGAAPPGASPPGAAGAAPAAPPGASPPGWGPPNAGAPAGWGPPAGPQQGFGAPSGPPMTGGPAAPPSGQQAHYGAPPGAPVGAPTAPSGPAQDNADAALGAEDPKGYVITLLKAGEHARAVAFYQATFKVSAIMAREEIENLEQQLRR